MRIQPGSGTKTRRRGGELWKRVRAVSGTGPLRLVLILSLAVVVVVGSWYLLEGADLIDPLLFGRRARTGPGDGLPALYVELAPEAYQTMYRQWHASLRTGIPSLEESEWLHGQIRYDGRTVPVSVWLYGEPVEHWQESKWSLQVKLRAPPDAGSSSTLLEMRSFVARSPATHRPLDQWLYGEILRGVGVLAPRYRFAHLWMNGDDWGVYGLQETSSDTLLRSQRRSPGVIVRVDDSLYGRRQAQLEDGASGLVRVDEGMAVEIERDPALQEQVAVAVGRLKGFQSGQLAPAQVFDVEQIGRYLAHAQWWGARYGPRFGGERYAYNALTSRLEPIGGDAWPVEAAYAHRPGLAQYGDLAVMEAYLREVERIARPETLEELRAVYQDSLRHYQAALAREFPASTWTAPWELLSERQAILTRSLYPQETVRAYSSDLEADSTLRIHVANLTTYPVTLDTLVVGERKASISREWIAGEQGALLDPGAGPAVILLPAVGTGVRYLDLSVPASVQRELLPEGVSWDEPIHLSTHIAGLAETIVADVRRDLPALAASILPPRPTVEQALARHPFLAASERTGYLRLEPGDWDVSGDLVLPVGTGLLAAGPTHLRFDEGAILLADGPLLLHGRQGDEIYLTPKDDRWAGIIVLEAGDQVPSSLSYVTIRGTSGLERDGWRVPGGVTFYRSPVTLSHCRLLDTLAPVALQISETRFECEETEFGYVSATALQAQFAQGRSSGCRFHDVLGTAIAARGSRIDIEDLSMVRVYDPGVSARQNSALAVQGAFVEDVGVVVVSSDGAHVQIDDTLIRRVGTAGFAAYASRSEGSPGSVFASDVTFESEHEVQALVQPGNSVHLDGLAASGKAFEVDELSWRQEFTATIRPLGYSLGPSIWLTGYDYVSEELAPGEPLQLTLYWHTVSSLEREYTVFIHIRDAAEGIVAGWDTMPRQNTYPTTDWLAGEIVDDRHVVPLDLPPGDYHVALGMYHLGSGQRLPVYGRDGQPMPDAIILLDRGFRVSQR